MEQKYKSSADAMRQIIELAVCAGRHWQSPQTGFIHYCYSILDETVHATAPLYENFLFILALMRSRSADNITEAKGYLDHLLNFQQSEGATSGNFPVYMHEYSDCKDRLLGVHLLAPLYWIHKNFHSLLGADLKAKLEVRLMKLVHYCLKTHEEKEAPYHLAWKIGAGAQAIGMLLQQPELQTRGQRMVSKLQDHWDEAALCSPTTLAEVLVAFQMIYPSLSQALPAEIWQRITSSWHLPTCSYCGPGWKEYQRGKEPQPSLFDFFMGYFAESYNYRGFLDHPIQLQAALVQPTDDRLLPPEYPVELEGTLLDMPWKIYQTNAMAYSHLAKRKASVPQEKTFVPLSILWGDSDLAHTFVCQGGNIESIDFTSDWETITLRITLANTIPPEHREKRQEICFYFDQSPNSKTTVNSIAATTFQMGEQLVVEDPALKIAIDFAVEEGEGRFFGHIMKGNRPSQTTLVGKNRFEAFDWHLFLRSVERTAHCVVKVTLSLQHLR
jgi:hypothetical protein